MTTTLRYWLPALLLTTLISTCGPAPEPTEGENEGTETTQPTESKAPDFTFVSGERFGDITDDMAPDDILAKYGDEATAAALHGPEGITYEGYIIYLDTEREAEFTFTPGRQLAFTFDRPDSPWNALDGRLRIGITLEDLVELNGQPIVFSGIGWDYGGYLNDYNGGRLQDFTIRVDAAPEGDFPLKLSGDVQLHSADLSEEELRALVVHEISVRL